MTESIGQKVIVMMMLIVGIVAVEASGVMIEPNYSRECEIYCSLKCAYVSGKGRGLCLLLCLLDCKKSKPSQSVINCTSTCTESMCSRYYNSGN